VEISFFAILGWEEFFGDFRGERNFSTWKIGRRFRGECKM